VAAALIASHCRRRQTANPADAKNAHTNTKTDGNP
jgi:hypothetical protein